MKRSIWIWQLWGFAVASLGGTILHFLYEWLGEAAWIAPFSGVNESTWEHMKLLFWPTFIFAVFQSFFFRDREDFWCIKLRGILLGLALIPILFYTYNGDIGVARPDQHCDIFRFCRSGIYLRGSAAFGRDNCLQKAKACNSYFMCDCTLFYCFYIQGSSNRDLQGSSDGRIWNISKEAYFWYK